MLLLLQKICLLLVFFRCVHLFSYLCFSFLEELGTRSDFLSGYVHDKEKVHTGRKINGDCYFVLCQGGHRARGGRW